MPSVIRLVVAVALLSVLALPVSAQTVPQSREQIQLSFAPLVKLTAPAVVNIYANKRIRQRVMSPFLSDPFFREFFGDMAPPGMTRERMESSLGSGVIVRADGLVVTNNHVTDGADEIHVVLSDRREFDAELVTSDEKTDLAVLRLKGVTGALPALQLRDSDTVEVGDMVLAIGNPFAVGQTVTSGIISAVARTGLGINEGGTYLQTDAAINPGNSGGALITMDGKLIGINSAIYSRSGGSIGIGFAIPSNLVRAVIDAVASGKKHVVHPWLGLAVQEVTPEIAASLNLPRPMGVLVNAINKASPAASAGIKVGDVITTVNGREVNDPDALNFRVATMQVGGIAVFNVRRADGEKQISFTLIAPPETTPRRETLLTGKQPLAGATVINISPAVAEEYDIQGAEEGVMVLKVEPRSPAGDFGLRTGDLILAVNKQKITRVEDIMAATKKAVDGWHIQVQRGPQIMNVIVR